MKYVYSLILLIVTLALGSLLAKMQPTEGVWAPAGAPTLEYTFSIERETDTMTGAPHSHVSVLAAWDGAIYAEIPVKEYDLDCRETPAHPDNALAHLTCWWAGGGYELGIFDEEGRVLVKERMVDEGTAEEQVPPGAYAELLVLEERR